MHLPWPVFPKEPVCKCNLDLDSGYGHGVSVQECYCAANEWEDGVIKTVLDFIADAMDATENGCVIVPESSADIGSDHAAREQILYMTAVLLGKHGESYLPLEPRGYSELCHVPGLTYEAWHITSDFIEDDDLTGGFCYLAAIRPQFRKYAGSKLGKWPRFYELLCLPASWFLARDSLTDMHALTDDLTRTVEYEFGYPLFHVLVHVAQCMLPVIIPGSMHEALLSYDDALTDLGFCVPEPECRVGGVPIRWHVSVGFEKPRAEPTGYCYLMLFERVLRAQISELLGAWPTLEQIMSMPYGKFAQRKRLRYLMFVDLNAIGRPVAVDAHSAMVVAAHKLKSLDKDTMAGRLYKHCQPALEQNIVSPNYYDRVGGSFRGTEAMVDVVRTFRGQFKPIMSEGDADRVLVSLMMAWGMTNIEVNRDMVLTSLAEVFVKGSNNHAVQAAFVNIDGDLKPCSVLCDLTSKVVQANNSVRMWIKSYRGGEIVLRISGLLDTPENKALRQAAMYKYGVTSALVHMCFDTTSVLRHLRPLTFAESVFVRVAFRLVSKDKPPKGYWSRFILDAGDFLRYE